MNQEFSLDITPEQRIKRGRLRLQKEFPFFSNLALRFRLKETNTVPTAGVSAKGILYYNPEWIKETDIKLMKTIVAHEALHIGLNHTIRKGNKDPAIWNIAIDYVVNGILKKNGLKVYDWMLYKKKYVDENAEAVYWDLLDDAEEIKRKTGKPGSEKEPRRLDTHKDDEQAMSKEEQKEKTQEWEERMEEAIKYSQQRGETPKGMERLVQEVLDNKLNYQKLLRQYIENRIPFDYTYKRPAKKSFATGYYFPKTHSENLDLIVAIDSSGSISQKQLKQFLGEINAINQSFQSVNLKIIIGDAQLQEEYHFRNRHRITPEDITITGGGGTDHHWVFDWVEKHSEGSRILIAFTDGYTSFPPKTSINTIWISTGLDPEEYPFGRAVKVE